MKIKKLFYFIVPLVFSFVACGDAVTTMNTSYNTLYGKASAQFTTLAGVTMSASKYGKSCFTLDPEADFVALSTINYISTTGINNPEVNLMLNRVVLEIQPINGTGGTAQIRTANNGIPVGPIFQGSPFNSTFTIPKGDNIDVFQVPLIDDITNTLINNQYEVWHTFYVQEYKGKKATSPEGWFQAYWGLLYTAPNPGEDEESACVGLVGGGGQ